MHREAALLFQELIFVKDQINEAKSKPGKNY
jgi:hypothetical protein